MLNNRKESSTLTLSKLSAKIKEHLNDGFQEQFWVIAEISELHLNSSGHAYLELIEKKAGSDRILARMRATIWSYTFRMLRPYFEGSTGYQLTAGIKVLVYVSLEYHPLYSLSLNIKDIDPNYTLGDLARKKAEIIEKLQREGVLDMNKQIEFPRVPQRIAVISSPTAAGFEDFLKTLSANEYGFHFQVNLYQAVMQGQKTADSIIRALEAIYENEELFDLVVIIRGGGASIELECFNDYELAFHITQFPLPVLTGIGHERDETVADIVANKKLKTPTAVAELLIDRLAEFLGKIQDSEKYVNELAKERIRVEREHLSKISQGLVIHTRQSLYNAESILNDKSHELKAALRASLSFSHNILEEKKRYLAYYLNTYFLNEQGELTEVLKNIITSSRIRIKGEKEKLVSLQKIAELSNPEYILSRGYSVTFHKGKVLKDHKTVNKDDELTTLLNKGTVKSKVK